MAQRFKIKNNKKRGGGVDTINVTNQTELGRWVQDHMVKRKRGDGKYDGSNNLGMYVLRPSENAFWNEETGELSNQVIPGGRQINLIAKLLSHDYNTSHIKHYETVWKSMGSHIPAYVGHAILHDQKQALVTELWEHDFIDYYEQLVDMANPIWAEFVSQVKSSLNKEWSTIDEIRANPYVIEHTKDYVSAYTQPIIRKIYETQDIYAIAKYIPNPDEYMSLLDKPYTVADTRLYDFAKQFKTNGDALKSYLSGEFDSLFTEFDVDLEYSYEDVMVQFEEVLDLVWRDFLQDPVAQIVLRHEIPRAIESKWWMSEAATPYLLQLSKKDARFQPRIAEKLRKIIELSLNEPHTAEFFKTLIKKINNTIIRIYGTDITIYLASQFICQRDIQYPTNTNHVVRNTTETEHISFPFLPGLTIPRDNIDIAMIDMPNEKYSNCFESLLANMYKELFKYSPENAIYSILLEHFKLGSHFPLPMMPYVKLPQNFQADDVIRLYRANTSFTGGKGKKSPTSSYIKWNNRIYLVRKLNTDKCIRCKGQNVLLKSIRGKYRYVVP